MNKSSVKLIIFFCNFYDITSKQARIFLFVLFPSLLFLKGKKSVFSLVKLQNWNNARSNFSSTFEVT